MSSEETTADIGPVEYMIVAFPGNNFKGQILPELARLVESGTIRIIDLAFVGRHANGDAISYEISDLERPVQDEVGSIAHEVRGLFSAEDLQAAAEELEPNQSAALLVWEDVWATKLVAAIRAAGGELWDLERIPHDVVMAAHQSGELKAAK